MADADPHPPEIRADMGAHAAQAVVAGDAAAPLRADLAGGQVDLVMQDDDRRRGQAVEAHRRADGASRFVHVGLRLEGAHRALAHAPLGERALEPRARPEGAEAVARRQRVEGHEARVVAMPRRPGAGIAEAHEKADRGAHRARAAPAGERGARTRRPPPRPPPRRRPPGRPRRPPRPPAPRLPRPLRLRRPPPSARRWWRW